MPKLALEDFLDAVAISGATDNTWRAVKAAGYDTLEKVRALTPAELAVVPRESGVLVGHVNAAKILTSLNSPRIAELLDRSHVYLDTTVKVAAPVSDVPLKIDVAGLTVVMTGTGPAPREDLEARLRAAGAIIGGSVNGKTNILVCSDPLSNTGKMKKARDLGLTPKGYDEVF